MYVCMKNYLPVTCVCLYVSMYLCMYVNTRTTLPGSKEEKEEIEEDEEAKEQQATDCVGLA